MSNIPPPSYGLAYLTLSQAYKYFVAIGSLAGTISASIAAVLAGNVTVGGNLTVSGTGTQQLGGSGALVQTANNVLDDGTSIATFRNLWVNNLTSGTNAFLVQNNGTNIFRGNAASNAITTKNNTLDDGTSGNLTILGAHICSAATTPMVLQANAVTSGPSGALDNITNSSTASSWEFRLNGVAKGRVGYDTTNGIKLTNGNGDLILSQGTGTTTSKQLKTNNNTLDDGNGNMKFSGTNITNSSGNTIQLVSANNVPLLMNNTTVSATSSVFAVQANSVTKGYLGWDSTNGMKCVDGSSNIIWKSTGVSVLASKTNTLDDGSSNGIATFGALTIGNGSSSAQFVSGAAAYGTATTGTSAGGTSTIVLNTTGTILSAVGSIVSGATDNGGFCKFGATSTAAVGSTFAWITFGTTFSSAPRMIVVGNSKGTAAATSTDTPIEWYVSNTTTTGFTVSNGLATAAVTGNFGFSWIVLA